MMNKKRLISVMLSAVFLTACGENQATEEVPAETSASSVQTTEAVQTEQATTETATVPVTTAENVNKTADIEVPENAVYKQTITSNGSYGLFERTVNIFDKNDNVLINVVYTSENEEPPTSWTIYTYDTDSRLIKEDFYYYNNKLLHYFEYEYDENGVMISDTEYDILNNGEVYEVKTKYIYDEKGRLSVKQTYQQNGSESYSYHYEYDEQDRLIKTNFKGRINSYCSYLYDENGNLSEKTDNGEFGITVTYYTYDDNNRLISAEDYHDGELIHTYEYEYEEL